MILIALVAAGAAWRNRPKPVNFSEYGSGRIKFYYVKSNYLSQKLPAIKAAVEAIEQVEVGDSWRYHPGGMDFDESAFWIPCAEYRPDSSTAVYRLQPGKHRIMRLMSTTTSVPWRVAAPTVISSVGRGVRAASIGGRLKVICRTCVSIPDSSSTTKTVNGSTQVTCCAAASPRSVCPLALAGSAGSDYSTSTAC